MADETQLKETSPEWVKVQQKTFTKWANTHLKKVGSEIADVETEFQSGIKLMQLIKALYGIEIPKHNTNPKMRINKLDNATLALDMIAKAQIKTNFLKTTHLVDCDLKMILGMLWAIILDYQIKGISVEDVSAKDALLLWCQKKTKGYNNVKVENFTYSWQDGLALCALIHHHRPDLINFDSLDKVNRRQNLQLAFDVAEKSLGISPLLEVDDVAEVERPDERSIMTYISEFYHKFAAGSQKENAARRIKKFARFNKSIEDMQDQYVKNGQELLEWINKKIEEFSDRTFDDDYENAKALLVAHKSFKTTEKATWNEKRLENETLFTNVNVRLRTAKRNPWNTPSPYTSEEIDAAWANLGEAESNRGKALRDNLARLKDLLKKQFGEHARNLTDYVEKTKADILAVGGTLEQQLESLHQHSEALDNSPLLKEVESHHRVLEAAGIADEENPYTDQTIEELLLLVDSLKNAIKKKKHFIENQLAASGTSNITPEQINEIKETFKFFDKNRSGGLDKLEFKACLQTLELTFSDDEINRLFQELAGGGERITLEAFLDFMIKQLQDTDDADQIKSSFSILSNGKPQIAGGELHVSPLENDDVNYLTGRMPESSGTFDYVTYTDSCFSK